MGSIEYTTCWDFQEYTIGGKLVNGVGDEWKIYDIRDSKELSRSDSKLVCLRELQWNGTSDSKLRMELIFKDGKQWYTYKVVNQYSNIIKELLSDLENLGD